MRGEGRGHGARVERCSTVFFRVWMLDREGDLIELRRVFGV